MVYTHEPLAAKASLTVNISGVGSPQQSAGNGAQPQQQEGNSRTGGENIQAVPGRLDDYKWYLLAGMGLLFAMSAFLLSRKQIIVAPAPEPIAPPASLPSKPKSKPAPAPAPTTAQATPPIAPVASPVNGVAAVNEQVNTSLDSLKDSIFRLELRHQAGTISEEEYASERARMEQLIRDLVRG